MSFFTPSEFQRGGENWYSRMSPELLEMLEEFRRRLGYKVYISPVRRAIGRYGGSSTSKHNIDRYGEVMAIDLMPHRFEPERWLKIAKEVGFTGIGLYPDWKPRPGLHLDNRKTRWTKPALWGAVRDTPNSRQRYVKLSEATKKALRYKRG